MWEGKGGKTPLPRQKKKKEKENWKAHQSGTIVNKMKKTGKVLLPRSCFCRRIRLATSLSDNLNCTDTPHTRFVSDICKGQPMLLLLALLIVYYAEIYCKYTAETHLSQNC